MECELSMLKKLDKCELLSLEELMALLKRVKPIFDAEPNVIDIKGPVTVVSDIHGQFFELLEIFKIGGDLPAHQYLFLGDIVDRGYHSIESFVYLLALKEMYPHRITILRGSHESRQITEVYGFYDEVMRKYQNNINLFDAFCSIFDSLPLCAIVDKKVFCLHGGLSPRKIRSTRKKHLFALKNTNNVLSPDIDTIDHILAIDRKQDIPVEGPMTDLLYSMPEDIEGFGMSPRGAGNIFGSDIVHQFLKDNDLELIIQSSYLREDGAEFIFDGKLLKLFSPTHYTYVEKNRGAIVLLYLDKDGNMQKWISFVPQSQKTVDFLESKKKSNFFDHFDH